MAEEKVTTAKLTQEMSTPHGEPVRAETKLDLPNTPHGQLAKIWYILGPVGAVIVAFLVMMTTMMYNSSTAQTASIRSLQNQLENQAKQIESIHEVARREREQMTERYIKSREQMSKLYSDILSKLDKVIIFIDRLVDWLWKKDLTDRPKLMINPK